MQGKHRSRLTLERWVRLLKYPRTFYLCTIKVISLLAFSLDLIIFHFSLHQEIKSLQLLKNLIRNLSFELSLQLNLLKSKQRMQYLLITSKSTKLQKWLKSQRISFCFYWRASEYKQLQMILKAEGILQQAQSVYYKEFSFLQIVYHWLYLHMLWSLQRILKP